jgi:hypothetical protein
VVVCCRETAECQPVAQAEAALTEASTAVSRASEIEQALDGELGRSEQRLADAQRKVLETKVEILLASPALVNLLTDRDDAWMRLRSLYAAFDIISHELPGLPEKLRVRFLPSEPLETGRFHGGDGRLVEYAFDRELLETWRQALRALNDSQPRHCRESDSWPA